MKGEGSGHINVEELEVYLGKRIKLTCEFETGKIIFYTGMIMNIWDSSVQILDKFDKRVTIDFDNIRKVEEE